MLLSNRNSTSFCVRSQADTATAARRCSKPRHDLGRQVHTSISRWASVLLRHKVSALPFQGSRRTFFNSLITNLFFWWHAVQRSRFLDSTHRENNVLVCHWRFANPDTTTPSLIQSACRHGRVHVHHSHSFSQWQHLARVCFPHNTHKCSSPVVFHLEPRQAPRCVTNQPRYQDAVARQFSSKRFSSDSHIARQTPLSSRFAFSISVRLTCLLCTALNSCTNTGSWSECSITTLCPSASTNARMVSTRYSLNAFVGHTRNKHQLR